MRVLVAEDDEALRSVLERGLGAAGYVVDAVADGEQALDYLGIYEYEAAIVDWRMPVMSGIELVAQVRRLGIPVPVLMLTARDLPADRVQGLDAGSDDYLVKPFDFDELLARLRALQRRRRESLSPTVSVGDLVYEASSRTVRTGKTELKLTQTELGILELLLVRSPAVVSRQSIAIQVWQQEADAVGSNTIDVHIARLRSKLVGAHVHIETRRGLGYRLVLAT
ncbi:MAG TPA: response regulator transcription factor [Acidimicrobiales bacterium]|jgi:DNA-binding response OmpR family regulator|nr:response regulator transcription factor [Acidimicrobiales bacterium]